MSAVTTTDFSVIRDLADRRLAPVSSHSETVQKGGIFVALPRAVPVTDTGPDYTGSAQFLADAVRAGARYVVCTKEVLDEARALLPSGAAPGISPDIAPGATPEMPPHISPDTTIAAAIVNDPRAALGELASAWYKTASSPVKLVAVTGTNGKTTSAYLLEAILRAAGFTPGVIGTVEYRWPGHQEASPLTTPDCMALHGMLAAMRDAGARSAVMEVSSHAIEQNRIAGLCFAGALFTNLTQDHLDYHRDMEDYYEVKSRLFANTADSRAAVNVDDPYGQRLWKATPGALGFGFGREGERILKGTILEQSRNGLHLSMTWSGTTWEIKSPLVGAFNAANLLGAQALALALGVPLEALQVLENFGGVPGRLERVVNPQGLSVFVDYAHTPDALEKALAALRGAGFGRVLTVFGCGGDRDRSKRPLMGRAAAHLSDVVVLTSDNPRREDPARIMADVRPGLAGAKKVIEEADRKRAIAVALETLGPEDALLIAGKGHEPYQIIGDVKYPFSDQAVVRELLGCE